MYQDDGDLEQRLARFEAQLDRFNLALHQWQHSQDAPSATARDVDQRLRTLEETIDREVHVVRQLHEEPLKQLQAQSDALKEICAAAVHSINGLDQAESRLAAIQADVQLHMGELTRALQGLVADLRLGAGASTALAAQGPASAWPLERVVHLHDELRRTASGEIGPAAPSGATAADSGGLPTTRGPVIDHASDAGSGAATSLWGIDRRTWYVGGAVVVVAGLAMIGFFRRIETKLDDAGARVMAAERHAEAATQLANREVLAARREADREIAEARESAQRAETVGGVLTAPDLIRFNLAGIAAGDRSSAQVLWSRTRGVVLSGSRLPAPPADTTYQLWLLTNGEPVSAGIFAPDATGRASLVTSTPPRVAAAVVGAQVTIEPGGGGAAPSGRALLVRLP